MISQVSYSVIIAVCSSTVFAAAVSAQVVVGPTISADECTAGVASLTAGERAGEWEFVSACGQPGVAAIAAAVVALRNETDSLYLRKLTTVASSIRHPDVLSASQQIASDNSATVPARLSALLIMAAQYDNALTLPIRCSWDQFITSGTGCRLTRVEDAEYVQEGVMPADYVATIANTASQIASNTQNPAVIRDFADYLRAFLSHQIPETVTPASIVVSYICANKFRVTNSGSVPAMGNYQVGGTTERGDIAVPSGGSIEIITVMAGPITLSFPGFSTVPTPNGGSSCT
jgi:hypothetical protein